MTEMYFTQHSIYLILNCTVILETRWENKSYKYVEFRIDNMSRILCVQHTKWIF